MQECERDGPGYRHFERLRLGSPLLKVATQCRILLVMTGS